MKKNTSQITILVDTREKQPLTFEDGKDIRCWTQTLKCGDYSMLGFNEFDQLYSIVIERKKTCIELVGNVGRNWETFKRELDKMSKYQTKLILVEEPPCFQRLYDEGKTKLSPKFVRRQLDIALIDYGVNTIFFNTRKDLEDCIARLFYRNITLYREKHVAKS